ncbi:unnamed protein product [Ophioblennius macclurei]
MLRHTHILTWPCPKRPLQHLSALSELAGAGRPGLRNVKERGSEEMDASGRDDSVSARTVSCLRQMSFSFSHCDNYHPTENSLQSVPSKAIPLNHHRHPQDSAAAKNKQASDLVSTYLDCLFNVTGLRSRKRFWDFCQPSLSKTYLHHMQHFVRPICLSTYAPWISNLHSRPQFPSILLHQSRAVHQVVPRTENTWRDCLSPVNEDRCRQNLEPNLNLYQTEKSSKGANLSQVNNRARAASVLVSLCSVEGEPSFLFTLRSSTLKGRHKGDVSFAGGKSDPSDADVVTTALREAKEELGVTVAAEQVWGVLKPLKDATGMTVAPVLANLGPLEELTFKPNPGEVEEIFTISLSHLCNPQNRGYTHFRVGNKYSYTLPVFRNGKHRVWGLTAIALDHTLKLIVPR